MVKPIAVAMVAVFAAGCAGNNGVEACSIPSGGEPPPSLSASTAPAPAAPPSTPAAPVSSAAPTVDPVDALHRSAIVIDTHDDVTQRLVNEGTDLGVRQTEGQTDVPRMVEGGLDAEFLSVWVPPQLFPKDAAYTHSIAEFDAIDAFLSHHTDTTVLATTAAGVRAGAAQGKTVFLIGVEGGHSLGEGTDDKLIGRLKEFFQRGARYMTLTWSNSNRLGGSSGDAGKTKGLTPFGRRVVKEMNALGMMVDISHVSDATFFDAVKASRLPVIASHSSSRALADRPRNMTDDMLRAVAANGGAVCVNFGPEFLDAHWHEASEAVQKEAGFDPVKVIKEHGADTKAAQLALWAQFRELARKVPPVPASVVIDHIEHITKVAGVDHVCIGSDFDGIPIGPAGLDDVSQFPYVTHELVRRGWSPDDVKKVLGENVLRVMEANEHGATEHGDTARAEGHGSPP